MELNEKQLDLIGDYLQGGLEGEALSTFLNEVDENSLLKKELEIQQAIQNGIEHKNNQDLRVRFNKIANESKMPKKKAKVFSLSSVRIAISAAAVALLCFIAYNMLDNGANNSSLYANYFVPSELTITRSTDVAAEMANLKELYNTKQYKKALPLFKQIIAEEPTANLRLAYGSTLLECKKVEEARMQFLNIIEAKDPLYSDQSRWYLSLLELNSGNVETSKKYLNQLLSDANSDYYTEAQKLLDEINALKK